MADVLAADISRLDPSSAEIIAANLATLKQRLLTLKAETDVALAEVDDLTAIALSPHFAYLASDFGIALAASITAAPNEWTPARSAKFAEWLKANGVTVVLLDAESGPALAASFEGAGATIALLSNVEGRIRISSRWRKATLPGSAQRSSSGRIGSKRRTPPD